jgi:hypothetical protein
MMSDPKAGLPEVSILPNGDLDCDDDPSREIYAELEAFSIGDPEAVTARRRRESAQREAEESAAAIARAAEKARLEFRREHEEQSITQVRRNGHEWKPAERLAEFSELIRTAAKEAGRDNKIFCKLLRDVPVPRKWGVKSWMDAYEKYPAKVRGLKRRALNSAP